MYIHTYTHTHTYTHKHTHTNTHTHTHTHIHVYACMDCHEASSMVLHDTYLICAHSEIMHITLYFILNLSRRIHKYTYIIDTYTYIFMYTYIHEKLGLSHVFCNKLERVTISC
jgi:hypothetical protein